MMNLDGSWIVDRQRTAWACACVRALIPLTRGRRPISRMT